MDDLGLLLFGLASSTALLEVVGGLLRKLREKITDQVVRKVLNITVLVLSCAFILGLLASLMWASTAFIYEGISATQRPSFTTILFAFGGLFILGLLFVHFFGYCFAGLLHRWPFKGRFWPKGIDYIYYLFGSAVLGLVVAEIYGERAVVVEALRAEVVFGVYLFNLKLFKTSYDLFPEVFKWSSGWVRDPFFGRVL